MQRLRETKKVISWIIIMTMLITMLPNNMVVKAAAEEVTSTDLTVHFKNELGWETVYGKFGAGASWNSIPGYEYCMNDFGGIIRENSVNSGWYTYRITKNNNAAVNGLFNCGAWGGENQTQNYSILITDEVMEIWITSNGSSDEEPDGWNGGYTAEAPINPADLSSVKSPVINADGSVTFNYEINVSKLDGNKLYLMGDKPLSDWDPGIEMSDEDGDGVYSVTIQEVAPGEYGYKFKYGGTWVTDPLNSKTTGGGNSLLAIAGSLTNEVIDNKNGTTKFVTLTETEGAVVKLVYGDKNAVELDSSALRTIEMSLTENGSYITEDLFFGDDALDIVYYYIVNNVEVILDDSNETVEIDGVKYSQYTRDAFEGRMTNVPGTFPGQSWNVTSNVMTYIGNGLYMYTFDDVPPANYEYKIAHGSWNENYGAKGVPGGDNIKVSVTKEQDIIVYYSDFSHNSRTSMDYEFGAEIKLTGTGFDETAFEDLRLTGIYSTTVNLPEGTYNDLKIKYKDQDYSLRTFELEVDKKVTFYFDQSTGIYYHNASDKVVDTTYIHFDTQDISYKSIFGAVATDEDVTYSIRTGADATNVQMVIKGKTLKTIDMEASIASDSDTKMWSATTSFDMLGEYNYFFVIYRDDAVSIYGDDDGYYGTGMASDLINVMPYDQIVYQSGYKTPDWMKKAVIYQIFPDRFFDGDVSNNRAQTSARGAVDYEYITDWYTVPENPEQLSDYPDNYPENAWSGDGHWSNEIYGGDLKGITENISYLKALGVNVIYLNPVFASISNHRYDTSDYEYIDPILGTEGDFDELVSIAEANDMYIILDGVFNHVSDDSKYFDRYYKYLEALKDSTEEDKAIGAYPFWAYVFDKMNEEDMNESAAKAAAKEYFTSEYGINVWTYTEWFDFYGANAYIQDDKGRNVQDTIGHRTEKNVYKYDGWWGYDSMPVIAATNGSEYQTPGYADEIIGSAESAKSDPDSNITQYWINKGMDGWRLDVANEVSDETWQKFRESVKALDSESVIIGEIWTDAIEYLMGDMYDSVMNYVFRGAVLDYSLGGNADNYIKTLEKLRERYPEEAFYAMMNLVGSHDTTRILSRLDDIYDDRDKEQAKDVDKAFPSYEKTSDLAKQRQYLVAFLQFTYPGAPTIYYGDEIGMVGADDPDDRRAMTWGKGNKDIVEWYAKLANTRNAYEVLQTGDISVFESGSDNIVSFIRSNKDSEMIVLANNAKDAVEVTLNLDALPVAKTNFTDVISGETYQVSGSSLTVNVPALSGLILTATADVKDVIIDTDNLKPAYDEAYIVADAKVTVSQTTANINIGNKITLTTTGRGTITWSTSNVNVANVVDGVVTAIGSGRATITATHSDGLTATCVVTVPGSSGGNSEGNTTTHGGTTEKPKEETVAPLELPTQKKEDGTVVTIVEAKGEYDFAATKVEGDLEISANGAVIKNLEMEAGSELIIKGKNVVIEDSDIKGTLSIPGGDAKTVTINGTTAPKLIVEKPTDNSTKRVRLNISDNCSIDKLYVNAGTKIEIMKSAAAKTAATKYTINDMYISVPEKAVVTLSGDYNKVTLSSKKTSLKLLEGKINKLTVKTTATNPDLILVKGTSITALTTTPKAASETLKYKSSNRKIAAVSGKGKLKAVKKGTATVTVTNSNGKAVKCKVTVK